MHPVLRLGYLLQRLGEVETRKKMQKIVHILQVTGAPFPEDFRFHLFGPYSSDLRAELDAFLAEDLIEEPEHGNTYTLKATPKLLELVASVPQPDGMDWLDVAEELNRKTPKELEGISTLLYFHQFGWPETAWEQKFSELKPQHARHYEMYRQEARRLLGRAA